MVDRSLGLARHLVFICFECGTRLSHRVYDPQIAYSTLVGDDRGKVTRVGRPEPVDAAAFAVAQRVGIEQAVWLPVAEILDPVGGDLRFDHGRVLLVLLELLVILARHAVEIHILGIDDRLAVGRYGCPAQLFGLLLLVLEVCKFTLFVVVREVEYLLALGLLGFLARKRILARELLGFCILRRDNFECEGASVLIHVEVAYGQLLGNEGFLYDLGELSRQLGVVEERLALPLVRIDYIPACALARLV